MKEDLITIVEDFKKDIITEEECKSKILTLFGINGDYVVFESGYEEGIEGMIQLSNSLKTLDRANTFCESWNSKNTYIAKMIK